jgi:hypothetical protein
VFDALFYGSFWLAGHLQDYAELGDYLPHRALVAVPDVSLLPRVQRRRHRAVDVFLADDLRLLVAAPVATRRLFTRAFSAPWSGVVDGRDLSRAGADRRRLGAMRRAGVRRRVWSTVVPFAVIPVAAGTAATFILVNTFPARRARDILMLMGLFFAGSLVLVLRVIRPERLLRVESLPDLTDFFATLQSPITPLPSFWAGKRSSPACSADAISSTPPRCGRRPWRRLWRSARRASGGISPATADRGSAQGALHTLFDRSTSWSAPCRCRRSGVIS